MCKRAKDRVGLQDVLIMTPTDLHCTSHVVDRDEHCEGKGMVEPIRDNLCFSCMFRNDHMCALSVSLTEEQALSLAKAVNQGWSESGPFVKS